MTTRAVLATLLLVGGCAVDTDDSARTANASVSISATGCGPSQASAVVVGNDMVLTAAHPIVGSTEVTVTASNGEVHRGVAVLVDTDLDVGIVRVDGLDITPIDVAAGRVDDVAAALLPQRTDKVRTTRLRRVVWASTTDIYRLDEVVKLSLELDIDISPGDSGAAVVDSRGALVGVIVSSASDDDIAYAVHIEEIAPLVADAEALVEPVDSRCWR